MTTRQRDPDDAAIANTPDEEFSEWWIVPSDGRIAFHRGYEAGVRRDLHAQESMHGFVRGVDLLRRRGCGHPSGFDGVENSSRRQQQNEDQGQGSGMAPMH
jgi:hypothetical protein